MGDKCEHNYFSIVTKTENVTTGEKTTETTEFILCCSRCADTKKIEQ